MTALAVRRAEWPLALLCSLVLVLGFTQSARAQTAPEAGNGADFHVKGVLLSQSGRSALVNDQVVREGEHLGAAEILAIRQGEVDIRLGSRFVTVPVGARTSGLAQASVVARYRQVVRGETLSGIAASLVSDGVTLNQMMIALYETNPDAFDSNINRLHEGANLRIPDGGGLREWTPAAATAEVLRQTDAWQQTENPQIRLAEVSEPDVYGPVRHGETLSGIAAGLSRDGATLNQTMIALYETNPSAFEGNINRLRGGAMLRIPGEAALLRHSHDTATAAVSDHMDAWRQDGLLPPADTVMASMRSNP